MNIKEKYGIQFSNMILDFGSYRRISKGMDTNSTILSEFFIDWRNVKDINEELLPDIEAGLQDPDAELENGSETVFILIIQKTVKFRKFGTNWLLKMPLADFKEIILLWIDFLETPPFHGTRV